MTTYALTNPDPTDPLRAPSHSDLHTSTNAAIASLSSRMGTIEGALTTTGADIEQARRVANTWILSTDDLQPGTIILPLLWNLSPRAVTFEAAKASVVVAPTTISIKVDIQIGEADPSVNGTSIFKTGPLVIAPWSYSSPSVSTSGFVTNLQQQQNSYLRVVVIDGDGPAELTVQLNRLL